MPRAKKPTTGKPATDTQLIRDAIADLEQDEQSSRKKKAKEAKATGKVAWWRRIDRRVAWVGVVILVVLVADGVRRENREFSAMLISATGTVTLTDAAGSAVATKTGARLAAGGTVTTGAASKAVLELGDGTRLVVSADSEMTINGLDYNRSAQYRDHAFRVSKGKALASVSERFGADSELEVGTPGAVAAVRGTVFLVQYDPQSKASFAACQEGTVALTSNGVQWGSVNAGQYRGVTAAGALSAEGALPESVRQEFLAAGELNLPPSKDPLMGRIEGSLNTIFDPVLSVLGIGKSSWGVLAGNRARKEAARLAARDLQVLMESMTDLPPHLNLQTLEGLGLSEERRTQILAQVAGNRLDGYVANEREYMLVLRGKDREKSVFLATHEGVRNVTDDPGAIEAMKQRLGLTEQPVQPVGTAAR